MVETTLPPDLIIGIPEIDRQHSRIIAYLNQIEELDVTADRSGIGNLIEEVLDYTVSHFVFEETLMEEAGYPLTMVHKKIHDLFIRRVNELKERFFRDEDVLNELHELLSRWLFNHIRTEDRNYAEIVTAHMKNAGYKALSGSHEEMDKEMLQNENMKNRKESWLKRLFGH